MLLMNLDSGSRSPLSDCSRAGHLSPGRGFPSSEGSFTSSFTLLPLTFRLAFEGRAKAAARPASFTIISKSSRWTRSRAGLHPTRSRLTVPRVPGSPERLQVRRRTFLRTCSFWTRDSLEADAVVAELRAPGCGGVGGSQGSGCHLHLQDSASGH